MGISTNGQLSFGVVLDEDFEFPWDNEKHDYDAHDWWQELNGYENPHFCPFDEHGHYKPGIDGDSPEVKVYFQHLSNWKKAHPFPVELVNYCSDSCPMYVVAIKHIECSRGYPKEIDPEFLNTERRSVWQRLGSWLNRKNPLPPADEIRGSRPKKRNVTDEERKQLRAFLDLCGIEASEPKWWLTSYWG